MILEGALKIEDLLECELCNSTLLQTTIVGECGHRFCLKCIQKALNEQPICPTCQKPAHIKNLKPDNIMDNLLAYIDNLKSELLGHTLTPVELSFQQHLQMNQINPTSDETNEEYQIEDSSMDDVMLPVNDLLGQKRVLADIDTQTTTNEEEELEKEFDDSLLQSAGDPHIIKKLKSAVDDHDAKSSLPQPTKSSTDTQHGINETEKMRLLNPKHLLGGLFSFSQEDELESQPQRNDSSAFASASGNSESDATQVDQVSATEHQPIGDEPEPHSSQPVADAVEVKYAIPSTIYSDSEDNKDESDMWKCSKCQYDNKAYLQTCGICHSYRNKRVSVVPALTRSAKDQSKTNTSLSTTTTKEAAADKSDKEDPSTNKKEPYQLTVAADEKEAQVEGTLTLPHTRKRTDNEGGRKEVHILYTGLTPEDEKKLDKIKEEANQKLKIVIHYQMRNFDDVTHIITSVDKQRLCKRTLKYLQGVLKGKWIVEPKWVIDSNKAKQWQAEEKYEVQGDHLTGKTNAPKLARGSDLLFQDMKFYLFGDFTGKHNKHDLLVLCRAGGAKILNRKPSASRADQDLDTFDPQEPIVIKSSEQKKTPAWLQHFQVRDPQWIIDCISKFKVE